MSPWFCWLRLLIDPQHIDKMIGDVYLHNQFHNKNADNFMIWQCMTIVWLKEEAGSKLMVDSLAAFISMRTSLITLTDE